MEPFDRDRALEDLEKLHEQILHARAQRGRVEDEFDAFTRGFRGGRAQPSGPDAASGTFGRQLRDADTPQIPQAHRAIITPQPSRGRSARVLPVVAVAAVLAITATIFAIRQPRPEPASTTSDTPAPAATAAASGSASPAPPSDAPPTPAQAPARSAAPGVNVEMTTLRRVWVRVTLDGKRAFEREVPAGQRLPLHADRSIAIRAGDAGAVTVSQNGAAAGPLGRDGVVATREFTIGYHAR